MRRQSQRNDQFTAFVAAQRQALLRTAVLMSAGDIARAEDAVQTALTKLYVAWPSASRADDPLAYSRRVLTNVIIDDSRRAYRRRERLGAIEPGVAVDQPDCDLRPALQQALAELPTRQRAVVVLRHWLDLDVEETARLLGCSSGTVKSQTSKALARLRALLGPVVSLDAGEPSDQPNAIRTDTTPHEETPCTI